jgi:DNA-binding NarL/FixJ family response regulator
VTPLRILVADDHEVVRRGVCALLEAHPDWRICAEAAEGREAVEKATLLRPDVVILDVGMPGLNGLEAARRIREASPPSEVLILTMHESEQIIREVVTVGARGYVLKSDAGRDLVKAVEAISQHKPFFTSRVAEVVSHAHPDERPPGQQGDLSMLTHREREVTQLLAEGKSNKEVASVLGISVRTAETHRTNIMRKLGCQSFSDLVRYALRNGLILP